MVELTKLLGGLDAYFTAFGLMTLTLFFILIFACVWLRRLNKVKARTEIQVSKTFPKDPKSKFRIDDLNAIAGEDLIATQLDLARAYIEMNEKKIAKTILDHVKHKGNSSQQEQADKLILTL